MAGNGRTTGGDSLGGNLVLRCVRDDSDVARLVDMYTRGQNAVEGRTAASLLGGHGRLRREEYLLVEDLSSGEIVSTTCLIPWTLRFCGIPFSCAQVEMVYTSPSHRNRGLVRRQFERLHALAREAGYDILVIWGIPFYYRQFGYSYAIEGCTTETVSAATVPGAAGGTVGFRRATTADIPGPAPVPRWACIPARHPHRSRGRALAVHDRRCPPARPRRRARWKGGGLRRGRSPGQVGAGCRKWDFRQGNGPGRSWCPRAGARRDRREVAPAEPARGSRAGPGQRARDERAVAHPRSRPPGLFSRSFAPSWTGAWRHRRSGQRTGSSCSTSTARLSAS